MEVGHAQRIHGTKNRHLRASLHVRVRIFRITKCTGVVEVENRFRDADGLESDPDTGGKQNCKPREVAELRLAVVVTKPYAPTSSTSGKCTARTGP